MRSLVNKRIAFTTFIFMFSICSSANETKNAPFRLQSAYQPTGSSEKSCLVAKGNEGNVAIAPCGREAKPDGLYILMKSVDDYYTIRPANNSEQCLRTFAGDQKIKLAPCAEDRDTPANYSSMRDWRLIKIDGMYNLENKYKSDIGSIYSCISVTGSDDSVAVGECSIAGGSAEYNNMRLWRRVN